MGLAHLPPRDRPTTSSPTAAAIARRGLCHHGGADPGALAQIKWRIADRRTIARSRIARDLITAAVSLIFSMLFVGFSTNTAATGFAVYEPFVYLAGALLLGVPVYLVNRSRMTAPPPAP